MDRPQQGVQYPPVQVMLRQIIMHHAACKLKALTLSFSPQSPREDFDRSLNFPEQHNTWNRPSRPCKPITYTAVYTAAGQTIPSKQGTDQPIMKE